MVVCQIQNDEGNFDEYIFPDHAMTDLRHPIFRKNAYVGNIYPPEISQKLKSHKYNESRMKVSDNNCLVDFLNYFLTEDWKHTTFIAFNSSRFVIGVESNRIEQISNRFY